MEKIKPVLVGNQQVIIDGLGFLLSSETGIAFKGLAKNSEGFE